VGTGAGSVGTGAGSIGTGAGSVGTGAGSVGTGAEGVGTDAERPGTSGGGTGAGSKQYALNAENCLAVSGCIYGFSSGRKTCGSSQKSYLCDTVKQECII
jgi:hypothetical protein